MDEQHAWTCDCGYGEPEAEDSMATLRRWAAHVKSAHGEEAYREAIEELVREQAEELREGTIMTDPFTEHEFWMGEPPGGGAR